MSFVGLVYLPNDTHITELFIFPTDGDIDFILAPAVGSLTTASTGTSQGPSTSTIPGISHIHDGGLRR